MTPSSFPHRHLLRRRLAVLGLAPLLALAGCTSLLMPDRVVLGEAELAAALDRAFPLQRPLLEVLDVRVSRPMLTLKPETNRVGAALEVGAVDRLFGQSLRGRVAFDTALRFEPADQTLRMAEVRVQEFRLDEGAAPSAAAQRLGAALAERVLEGFVVYRLRPDQQARLAGAGVQPGTVRITSRGVEIALARSAR